MEKRKTVKQNFEIQLLTYSEDIINKQLSKMKDEKKLNLFNTGVMIPISEIEKISLILLKALIMINKKQ